MAQRARRFIKCRLTFSAFAALELGGEYRLIAWPMWRHQSHLPRQPFLGGPFQRAAQEVKALFCLTLVIKIAFKCIELALLVF